MAIGAPGPPPAVVVVVPNVPYGAAVEALLVVELPAVLFLLVVLPVVFANVNAARRSVVA